MPRVADVVALALFCACYLLNLGTLMGVDMIWSLALFPIAGAYAYYSRHEIRRARRAGTVFRPIAKRFTFLIGVYPAIGLFALFAEQLVVGGIYNGHVVDFWNNVRIATHADIFREHAFLVFGFLGLASLCLAYPAARAIFAIRTAEPVRAFPK